MLLLCLVDGTSLCIEHASELRLDWRVVA